MRKLIKIWRDNRSVLLFISLMLVFRSAVADWNDVPTGSMQPTIEIGDRVLVNKMAYDIRVPFTTVSLAKLADPQRGEIVIFESDVADNRLIKRVVAIPGDTVTLQNNALSINGQQAEYKLQAKHPGFTDLTEQINNQQYTVRLANTPTGHDSFNKVIVPDGHYLVLGDNRDNSADSRVIGFVPRSEIVGRARTVLFSLNYDNYFLPRTERFLAAL